MTLRDIAEIAAAIFATWATILLAAAITLDVWGDFNWLTAWRIATWQ